MKINASPRTKGEFLRQQNLVKSLQEQVAALKAQLAINESVLDRKVAPEPRRSLERAQIGSTLRNINHLAQVDSDTPVMGNEQEMLEIVTS